MRSLLRLFVHNFNIKATKQFSLLKGKICNKHIQSNNNSAQVVRTNLKSLSLSLTSFQFTHFPFFFFFFTACTFITICSWLLLFFDYLCIYFHICLYKCLWLLLLLFIVIYVPLLLTCSSIFNFLTLKNTHRRPHA